MVIPMDARIIVKNKYERFFYHSSEKYFNGINPNSICQVVDMKGEFRKILRSYLEYVELIPDFQARRREEIHARVIGKISEGVQQVQDIGGIGSETETNLCLSGEGGEEESE